MKINRPRTRPRRGFTLIELLVVISVSAVIATLAITTIVSLERLSSSHTREVEAINLITEFGRRFRNDVHAATSAESSDELILRTPNGVVRYRPVDDGITRSVDDGYAEKLSLPKRNVTWTTTDTFVRADVVRVDDNGGLPWQFDAALGINTANGSVE